MKKFAIPVFVFLVLFTASAGAEKFDVLEISDSEVYCQILNADLECQFLDNQLSVTIWSDMDDMEADMDLVCGKKTIETYPYSCNRTENLYTCYFDLEPITQLTGVDGMDCEMNFYFYTRFSNESMGSEKYGGSLKIIPLWETSLLSLQKQKAKLLNDFSHVKYFDWESVYNIGICSYLGAGIQFGKISDYEDDFKGFGGLLIPAKTVSGRSLNLLKTSSTLASDYVEGGDVFLSILIDHFLYQGIMTGRFINDILYQLSEGYLWGGIFRDLENDVDGSCEKIQDNFEQVVNPNFLAISKFRLIDCLEKRDFKNCWEKLGEMEEYVNPGNSPERSEIRFYLSGYLLRDRANVCGDNQLNMVYSNIDRFGIDKVTVTGDGDCKNTINIFEGDGNGTYSISEFLCGQDEPVNGGRYTIEVDPGVFGEKVTYILNYYEDVKNCRIRQEVILV